MQGDFVSLLIEEDTCVTWKSLIWSVPRGVAKFAINAGLNTLPLADNLKQWGERTTDLCTVWVGNRLLVISFRIAIAHLSKVATLGGTIRF